MFDDNKKLIGIIGIILVVLVITAAVMLKFRNQNHDVEPTESVESTVEVEPTPTPIIKEEEVKIDENLMAEAEDFLTSTKTMAERVNTPDDKATPEGELKRKAIASVLDIWDVDADTIKDDATTQKLKFAEATVAQTETALSESNSNSDLISRLKEILRRAEEEFKRRQADTEADTSETPETPEEPTSTTPPSGTSETTPTAPAQTESQTAVPETTTESTPTPTPTPIPAPQSSTTPTPTPQPTQTQNPTQPVQQTRTETVVTEPKHVLYEWVPGKTQASPKAIVEEKPYPYSKLTDDLKTSLDEFYNALEGEDDVLVLKKEYGFTESLTLLQAIDDIFFPYINSGVSARPDGENTIITGMKNARKAYKENDSIRKEIEKAADKIGKKNITEKQAVIDINNYICKTLHCDENAKAFSLKNGTANCRGYAAMFRDMCHKLGIKCDAVYGVIGTDKQGHAWNRVTVDGRVYYCDAVWNDGGSDEYPFMFSEQEWYGRGEQYPIISIEPSTLGVLEKEYRETTEVETKSTAESQETNQSQENKSITDSE